MYENILRQVLMNDLKAAEQKFQEASPGRAQLLEERKARGELNATQLVAELAEEQAKKIDGTQAATAPKNTTPETPNAERKQQAGKFPAPPRRK